MFNDSDWIETRTELQYGAFKVWLKAANNVVVIEIGAGTNIPSVRRKGEAIGAPVIRINPREPDVRRPGDVSLPMGALAALQAIRHEFN